LDTALAAVNLGIFLIFLIDLMRVLHTADWHLGQHFLTGQERLTEQKAFLNWLLDTVQAEGVEALVLAGDVFDTTTPAIFLILNRRPTRRRSCTIPFW
jgi:metallophosphoesterase superfamily enzyme